MEQAFDKIKSFTVKESFALESGMVLPEITIAYHSYGTLNAAKDNVIWICHALTANSDAADWWDGLVGKGTVFDPDKYFIVCANMIGSCYGSSGPLSTDPSTGNPYYSRFPMVTIRDMVKAHELLRVHLGIEKIAVAAGGSMGGYQILEWIVQRPGLIENMVLLVTGARESAWGIAVHTAQRMSIETDPTWQENSPAAGSQGMKTARAIGMLTYRNYETFVRTQTDEEIKTDHFKASSYIHYQGEKLAKRFNAYTYWLLTKAMDSHNIGRGRGSVEEVLKSIRSKALVVGIESDILCPVAEQKLLADNMPDAVLKVIDSSYGHDGFLIESDAITEAISCFLSARKERATK